MAESFSLTIEQQFELRAFADRVKSLSQEEAHELLVDLFELMMKKDAMYKHLMEQDWRC